jgi:hypothetical protein
VHAEDTLAASCIFAVLNTQLQGAGDALQYSEMCVVLVMLPQAHIVAPAHNLLWSLDPPGQRSLNNTLAFTALPYKVCAAPGLH